MRLPGDQQLSSELSAAITETIAKHMTKGKLYPTAHNIAVVTATMTSTLANMIVSSYSPDMVGKVADGCATTLLEMVAVLAKEEAERGRGI